MSLPFLFLTRGEAFQLVAHVNSSTTGCADGTREGFTDLAAFPDIAACSAAVVGYHVASAPGCAAGWRVCTGQDVWGMNIQKSDARAFSGRFAYDSNHDCGACFATCCTNGCSSASQSVNGVFGCSVSGGGDPDLAGMGSGSNSYGGTSCMQGGRIDVGNTGCNLHSSSLTGVVCCRDPTAPAPTPSPGASAVGDPHLQNVHGERFDLMKPGKHVLINIPRGVSAEKLLLRVQADARQLGGQCADMYFQELNVTGSWAEAKQVGGYHYSVSQPGVETPEWVAFGKVGLKVVHGRTDSGLSYLNVYVKHLGKAGFAVGGLLGEDDHADVITPSEACVKSISLIDGVQGGHKAPSVLSVAEASLA